jgi:hypothetical protein
VGFEELSEELSVSVVSSQWGKTDVRSFSLGRGEMYFVQRDSMTVARHEGPGVIRKIVPLFCAPQELRFKKQCGECSIKMVVDGHR